MRGVIATGDVDPAALVERARAIPPMEGADLVRGVTCAAPFDWRAAPASEDAGLRRVSPTPARRARAAAGGGLRLRDEVEHPAALRGARLRGARVPGDGAGRELLATSPTACS